MIAPTGRADAAGTLTVDDQEVASGLVEHVGALRATDDDVLDPDAVAVREVDARLDAEGDPGTQRLAVAPDQVRLLVDLETDAVTRRMGERVGPARLGAGPSPAASNSRRTVLGETRRPSFSSSPAIRG